MPSKIDPALCAKCKGTRRLCGRPRCPILERIEATLRVSSQIGRREIFSATPPSILVGEYGYPSVRLGPLASPVTGLQAKEYEDYEKWWGDKSLEDVIRLRASMVYSAFRVNVKKDARVAPRLLDSTRELALSALPVDAEFVFSKPPKPALTFDGILSPIGPRASLEKLKVAQNPVVPRRVDEIVDDVDVKASEAIFELYTSNVSSYHIVRLLSLGLLGEKRRRRIVPTRWSITAVDSMLGDRILEKIKDFPELSEILVYSNEYMGNRYIICLLPGRWTYEMLEIWLPRSIWVKDSKPYITVNYEFSDGVWRRPGVDGGYHAIRFPVLEHLYKIKRQALVIAVREVTPEYYAPVGSWQIRESIRNVFRGMPFRARGLTDVLKYIEKRVSTDIRLVLSKSVVLKNLFYSKRITDFMER
ncbi:MAG: hypothetical protein J7L38_04270 [Thermoproteales archaeon]|nr:hypothetical protein [Thermoproteales archaeon]RLE66041.1 MAG: hypothetical protein DRJ47_03500 [Thermoprotei archaeon]